MKSSLRIVYSLIVFVLGIVLLSVLTVLLIYENRQTQLSFHDVTQSHILRHSLERAFSALKEAESGQRGFLATADSSFLAESLEQHIVFQRLDEIDSLVTNDPIQQGDAKKLRRLFKEKLKRINSILQKSQREGYKDSEPYYHDLESGKNIMLNVRQVIDKMQSRIDLIIADQQEDARRHSILPAIIGIGISSFSILIFTVAFYFTNAELKKSIHLNDELETKNLQLEKYTQELSSFTNITTHDMQEPLRKIELFISIIEEREKSSLSPKALEHFRKIKESAAKMRQLFFNIFSFSLADQVRNIKDHVDLNDVLEETLESLKVYIKDTNAVISSEPLPFVFGVKPQLVQLFQNLISNSLKYKRADVIPEIYISSETIEGKNTSLRELNKDGLYHKLDFQDNGVGFDQQYVEKIFDIFQRHVQTESHGRGIGLSICRKIAQNHSGTITAESIINRGSLFSVYIPVDNGSNSPS